MTWPVASLESLAAPFKGSITDGPFGSNLARKHYRESGPLVIRLQNIGDGEFIDSPAHIDVDHFETLRKHEVLPEDLLVASLGDVLPRACLAPFNLGPAIVKADCIRVRLREDVDPRWVNYSLQRPSVRSWAERHRHGVGRPRLGLKGIRQIPVPSPPIAVQRRIVEILEDHLSRLDAADHYVTDLLRRRQAWLKAVLDDSVWGAIVPCTTVADVLREPMRNGRSDRASSEPGAIRTLTLTAVTKGDFGEHNTKLTSTMPDAAKGLWLEPGDIFVQRSNTPELVGTSARYEGPRDWAIFPDLLIRLRPDESRMDGRFLVAALQTERTHRNLRTKAKGLAGSMPKIDQRAVGETVVPLLPMPEQHRVVSRLAEFEAQADRLRASAMSTQQRSSALRKAVLSAAFEGRLTGRHTDDEVIGGLAEA